MKVLTVAVFVGCIVMTIGDSSSSLSSEEEAKFRELTDSCVSETGIEETAWQKVEDGDFDDPKMPEYLFCVFRKLGFLSDEGQYQIDSIKAGMTETYGEEIANRYIADCTKDIYSNGPETALHMATCYHDTVPESSE